MSSLFQVKVTAMCATLVSACVTPVSGADDIELKEAKAALEAATSRLAELEAGIETFRTSNEALTLALAESNLEVAESRSQADLAVKSLEALGVDLLSGLDGLPGRMLKAANNLRLAEAENSLLRKTLIQLSEVAIPFIGDAATADNHGATDSLRDAVAKANSALESEIGRSGVTQNRDFSKLTKIVGLKPDLGLVIVDAGEQVGLREGAPLRIFRGEDVIATALVVEVRPGVSGAILTGENSNFNAVAIGDIARLNLTNSFKN